jgi:hypothetical protein
MEEVVMVYQDVSIYQESSVHDARPNPIYTVSVDEKPGVQATELTAPDLPPVPGKASTVGRDYEYVRRGTVSIFAGIDLHSGQIFANVEERHRSVEFIALLMRLDEYYSSEAIIRVVLDNHSAHISKETMAYLAARPGALGVRSHIQAWLLAQSDRVSSLRWPALSCATSESNRSMN